MEFVLSCLILFLLVYLPTLISFVCSKRDTVLKFMCLNTVWFGMSFIIKSPSAPVFTVFDFMAFVLFMASYVILLNTVPDEKSPKKVDTELLK